MLVLLALCVSWSIACISNYLTKKREDKMFLHWEKIPDHTEAKIEAYGLGSLMSRTDNENSILIPMDILDKLAQKNEMKTEDLIMPYIKGLMNGQKENEA